MQPNLHLVVALKLAKIDPASIPKPKTCVLANWISDGKFTDSGLAMLRERMSHIDFSSFSSDPQVDKVANLITVQSLADFVSNKLSGETAST